MAPTEALYRADSYRTTCNARVSAATPEGAVALDQTVFYPTGGGQAGDCGKFTCEDGREYSVRIASWGSEGLILHHLEDAIGPPSSGTQLVAEIDWDIRYRRMRMHTAMHLLSVILPLPVTGGSVGEDKSRLDFNMPEPPGDKQAIADRLNELINADHPVGEEWIGADELAARPELVKTVGVRPPSGVGKVRLVRIGPAEAPIDLQPCGGTHVRSTAEIGLLRIGKIEKKGRSNRRVTLLFSD